MGLLPTTKDETNQSALIIRYLEFGDKRRVI